MAETTTYAYDAADRLTEVVYPEKHTIYTLDGVGDRLTERATATAGGAVTDLTSTYNTRHQLTTIVDGLNASNSVAYTYDANGNQLTRTVGGTGGVTTAFTFDVRDQLATVRQGASLLGAYGYDSRGLRVVKQGSLGYVHYTYDDHSVLYETDASGAALAKFDYGSDRLLSLTPGSGGRQFYLFDGLGSVTDLTNLDGSLRATYQYDAWGNPRSTSGQSFNLFGFTGHERDPETGLYYFKHRFYDPATGRFLTEDPMEGKADNPPSLQRYLYAYGNPTIYIDPDGRWPSLNDLIDVGTAAVESLVKTQRQVDKAVAKGIVNTAVNVLDFASLGSISAEKKRFDTFRNTKGSLIDKANAASQVSTVKERLNVVSLGFSSAPDKVQHLKDLTGVGSVQRAGQLLEDAYVDHDFNKALQGTAELSQGFVQLAGLAEGGISVGKFLRGGAARSAGVRVALQEGAGAGAAEAGPAIPPRRIPEATVTGESAQGGVEVGDTILRKSARASTDTPSGAELFQQLKAEGQAGDSIASRLGSEGRAAEAAGAAPNGDIYSVAYEMKLNSADIARSRSVHFNRANAALDAAVRSDPAFASEMERLIPGVGDSVSSAGGRSTPKNWIWHHAADPGVMQLVPEIQHTPGSIFWDTMHPGGRGGYSTWAIPAGAPRN